MSGQNKKISVVIPVFCSQSSLDSLNKKLMAELEQLDRPFEIVYVDDCSADESWHILQNLNKEHSGTVKIVRLLKNSGQHNALLCGFSIVTGDIVVTMDDDLQNPPREIGKLVAKIDEGYDLAIGSYAKKQHRRLRNIYGSFIDRLQRRMFSLPADFQLTSFRAMRRVVADNARNMIGVFPYITSMLLASSSLYCNVEVDHQPRASGKSNYSMRKNLRLAANLLFSYSSYPLYFVAFLCFLAFLFSIIFGGFTIYRVLAHGSSVPGWASTVVILTFFNGLILLCLLIYGIYISRLYQQISHTRKPYSIREMYE